MPVCHAARIAAVKWIKSIVIHVRRVLRMFITITSHNFRNDFYGRPLLFLPRHFVISHVAYIPRYSDLAAPAKRIFLFADISAATVTQELHVAYILAKRYFCRQTTYFRGGLRWRARGVVGNNGNKTNRPPCVVCLLKRSGGSRPHIICLIIARFLPTASFCAAEKKLSPLHLRLPHFLR